MKAMEKEFRDQHVMHNDQHESYVLENSCEMNWASEKEAVLRKYGFKGEKMDKAWTAIKRPKHQIQNKRENLLVKEWKKGLFKWRQ